MTTVAETTAPEPPPAAATKPTHSCANCGAPMHGPYCYACGQPEKGLIRQLASVMSDVLDTVFNIDSRVFRSMFPLYLRPGYLTLEYFAGRRVRYVTPFRLFFFLCLIAFFAIQIALNLGDPNFKWHINDDGDIASAQSEADVQQRTAKALSGINAAKSAPHMPAATIETLEKSAAKIQKEADDRVAYLKTRDAARASGKKAPPDPKDEGDDGEISFDGTPWDPASHPVNVAWLPEFANARINEMAARAKDNIVAAKRDPRRLIEAVFSRLPWTLGLLMPLFAVLLKIVYIFKRRLYMEHLMVALHSHAFIFMSLLLLAIVTLLRNWSVASAPGVEWVFKLMRDAIWIWLPVYLFLMQKRVYRQGWIMTSIKFTIIGICYTVIITIGLVGALLVTLASA
ncbi:MAG TPA: DUF3667 domain-containing protein [Rhodanobacteraceae bacterium]|jgi:hypothetical protein|nr:DUF3667 domain-containing protein [Rhodanobacteraceae bacterium]